MGLRDGKRLEQVLAHAQHQSDILFYEVWGVMGLDREGQGGGVGGMEGRRPKQGQAHAQHQNNISHRP